MSYLFIVGRRASRLISVEEHSEASVWGALQECDVWQLTLTLDTRKHTYELARAHSYTPLIGCQY